MLDFYKEMKMVDLIEREPIYKSKLLMEKVPSIKLDNGTDVYFIPVTTERLKDPLFSFLKDESCKMIGTIVDIVPPSDQTIFTDGIDHTESYEKLKERIGEPIYIPSLNHLFLKYPSPIRTDGNDVYVEYKCLIVKISYIPLWFEADSTVGTDISKEIYSKYINTMENKDKTAESGDLLNALIVYFNNVYARNVKQVEKLLWENISVASDRDTLRRIQVTGTYYPECSTIYRKENV